MARLLILFAHPALEKSRVHRRLLQALPKLSGLTFHDLYEVYPHFQIDIKREQKLLLAHDLVIFQHPFYWYSTPALLKQWQDLVLEHGWAYGTKGTALRGKKLLCLMTVGGGVQAYQRESFNRFTVREFLAPIEQTARLCGMTFLPPYIIYGTHRMNAPDIEATATSYRELLQRLHEDAIDLSATEGYPSLNAVLEAASGQEVRA